ncbi:MAG: TetR/AcrR family transcriptional regulator [Microcoleus sp. PH2017_29_MFU_D_A]|jgi:AcrR family transcriptional regulator|uniref:TetR/AcrR family transcriptional regulator n=2 Tax=unclassified Microcoleus TaxID=2642155 RepID=UPI001D89B638|nr:MULTISPECIES: TetR/AcrR family transcriptional regulator [unclassified Microcoleus]MCC3421491.1 TetR/AcrR family transcriptional regulator [Microcoleus sp. PH2017_07_MST_O_A]MCC3431359.1 TetR/AcrR family transcriptional regulator [Microcoleus sp. PH2017_04_SCI_O_A]MCC3506991.1 TetR/AcrR family transcriptional regulator [Microcoleus sp. PH2017_19_SFW_U_A]MCC3513212.1 TetR/AcrR family transcriptional regulator [Microcoleus sp. PH2017_17_BER_D_A]MCC3428200.1 TetR/AcrR family transcriptional re
MNVKQPAMPTKLTKAEQTLRTRRAILVRARHLFATKGYAATGTEEIISELGITRGALYHQFNDKLGVFKAVIAEAYGEITGYIRSKIQPLDNNWEQLVIGCQAFLEIAQQEELRRLVFIEAPAVLAADTLVEFDQYGFGLLYEAIQIAVKEGKLNTIDVEGFAHLVNGSLNELAAWVAQSNDPKRLKTAQQLIETLLTRHQV